MRNARRLIWLLAAVAVMLAVWGCRQANRPGPRKVKLAVVVVVDQMRADYLQRFAGYYHEGLARLLSEGYLFTNAHHDHSLTVTAAGHATISTGSFPAHHGIISNNWFDRIEQKKVYCSDDTSAKILGDAEAPGRSPARMLRPTLGDWLKQASPQSRVFAVSRKDRPAIMLGGKNPDGVFWYDGKTGRFVTSTYYAQTYPAWVDSFNAMKLADRYLESGWQRYAGVDTYFVAREDEFAPEFDGIHTTFPHRFPSDGGKPNAAYYRALETSPFTDELVLKFAEAMVEANDLGRDRIPDLLFVGLSSADAVGHAFGPLSQESEDLFLRLDHYLGEFLEFLDRTVGKDEYVLVLTGDHGVMPMPEELKRRGVDAKRIAVQDLFADARKAMAPVLARYGISENPIRTIANGIVLNEKALESAGGSREEIVAALAEALKTIPYVEDVFTFADLSPGADKSERAYYGRFRRSFHPERSADLMIRFKPNYLITGYPHGTSHGSPYDYDSHVPILFAGAGIASGRNGEYVRTVDIAPSLALWLGIQPPQEVDGKPLF